MQYKFSWLPDLFKLKEMSSFEEYYEQVFEIFKKDFMVSRPFFNGRYMGLQKEPMVNGKPQTFHHMTTESLNDSVNSKTRTIAMDRCERIAWNRAILESEYVGLKIFKEKRTKNRKKCSYMV